MVITLVMIAAFIGVATLIGGVAYMFNGMADNPVEERLEMLTCGSSVRKNEGTSREDSLLAHAIDRDQTTFLETFVSRFLNLRLFLDQANIHLRPSHFILLSFALMLTGGCAAIVASLHPLLVPMITLLAGAIPFA